MAQWVVYDSEGNRKETLQVDEEDSIHLLPEGEPSREEELLEVIVDLQEEYEELLDELVDYHQDTEYDAAEDVIQEFGPPQPRPLQEVAIIYYKMLLLLEEPNQSGPGLIEACREYHELQD